MKATPGSERHWNAMGTLMVDICDNPPTIAWITCGQQYRWCDTDNTTEETIPRSTVRPISFWNQIMKIHIEFQGLGILHCVRTAWSLMAITL